MGTVDAQLATLQQKHKDLDREISKLALQTQVDDTVLNNLKRKKLQIKDKLQELGAAP